MANGLVVILSGASSVGKHGIRNMLKNDPDLGLNYSISITTRPPKDNEKDGGDYYFVTFANFAKAVKNKELVEYTEFNGYYYGTPKAHLDFLLEHGKNVLLEEEAGFRSGLHIRPYPPLVNHQAHPFLGIVFIHDGAVFFNEFADPQGLLESGEVELLFKAGGRRLIAPVRSGEFTFPNREDRTKPDH
jgi:hypothetical protein